MLSKFVNDNIFPIKQFLLFPVDESDKTATKSMIASRFIFILFIDILVSLIVLGLISVLQNFKLINIESHKLNDIIKHFPLLYILIFGVILLPAVEEFLFRFFLRSSRYNPLQIIFYFFRSFQKESITKAYYSKYIWDKYYKIIFYSSAIIFGLYHLTNYTITFWIIIFSPILIFSQFVMGLLAGYLRVKFNFIWGLSLHIVHNAIFLAIPLIMMGESSEVINIRTKNYNIMISETKFGINNLSIHNSEYLDSIRIDNLSLKEIIPTLLEKDKQLIEFNDNIKSSTPLKINYTSSMKNCISNRDTILNILKKQYKFKIETSIQNRERWEIQVTDSNKLSKYICVKPLSISSYIKSTSDSIIIHNTQFREIAQFLSNVFKTHLIFQNESALKYNFNFKAHDFETCKSEMEKIGIKLNKNYYKAEITKIIF